MSEFKYACPVCGQHIKCDASQAGSVMECPTCFQKITVPQAPTTAEQKFILTGSKVTERKISVPGVAEPAAAAPEKPFPAAIFLVVIVVALAAGATVFFLTGKKNKPVAPPVKQVVAATNAAPKPKLLVAPPASDTNWLLTLDAAAIPDTPVAGRIHGQDFIIERAGFQNGVLTLRAGGRGPVEFGVQINFSGALPESLANKNLNILADTNKSARVTLRWKDDTGTVQKISYDINYAMRLEFGTLANNKLPGKIYLCTPDAEKSYLMGKFTAAVSRPKPKPPVPAPPKS